MAVIVYVLLFVGLFVSNTYAQPDSRLSIRLYDEARNALPKVEVKIDPLGIVTLSDTEGFCRIDALEPGRYFVQASAEAFLQLDTTIDIRGTGTQRIDLVLAPISAKLREVIVYSDPVEHSREFTKQEILESGSASLEGFLCERVGLDVIRDGDSGGKISARVGGSNPNQVVVLLDGRKIQSASDGIADLSAIPLDWIETVEIHRGSQTSIAGEAIGGIIDIKTRRLSENEEIRAAADVNAHRQVSTVSRSGAIGELESFISFSRTQGNGEYSYRIAEDDGNQQFTDQLGSVKQRVNNDLVRDQFFAKVAYRLRSDTRFELSGASDRADRGIPGYLSPRLTPLARESTGSHFLNAYYAAKTNAVDWRASASLTQSNRHFEDPDPYSLVHESRESDTRYSGSLEGRDELFSAMISGGMQLSEESFLSEQIEGDKALQRRWESWINAERCLLGHESYSSLKAHVGWRIERVGAAEPIGLPKLQLTARTNKLVDGSLSIGWGKSYRAPSFYSLFWQEDQVAKGNPDLLPEYSEEWTGNFILRPGFEKRLELSGSVSSQAVEDLIYWQRSFDGHWKPMNLKRADIQTLELQLEYTFFSDHVHILTGTTWTEARDATDDRNTGGKYLTFRPARTHRASCFVDWMEYHVTMSYQWIDSRPVLATNSKWLDEYDLLDMTISKQFRFDTIGMRPGVRVTNALNESYRVIRHAPMPLRVVSAIIQFTYIPAR